MKNPVLWGAIAVVAVLVGVTVWLVPQWRTTGTSDRTPGTNTQIAGPAPIPAAPPVAAPEAKVADEPKVEAAPGAPLATAPTTQESSATPGTQSSTIRYPIASRPSDLPSLSDSDKIVRGALIALIGAKPTDDFLRPIDVVRHVVATVDDLPRAKLPQQNRPLRATPGLFAASGEGDALAIDAGNPKRYGAFLRLIQSVDAERLVAMYRRFYPLFQQAYRESGQFPSYFNDRLVEVIDHMLAAPEIDGPIKLVQPKVMYAYADPVLESRSAGHKILIRMGPANAKIVKMKLREIRSLVTDPGMLRTDAK